MAEAARRPPVEKPDAPAPAAPAAPQPPASTPPTTTSTAGDDSRRLSVGRDLLGLALLTVLASLVLAIAFYRNAADVATVVAPVTTLVGTLIGAMFGVQAATQGNAQQAAQQQQTAQLAVGAALVQPGSDEAKALVNQLIANVSPPAGDAS
jgi:hypothetical protein